MSERHICARISPGVSMSFFLVMSLSLVGSVFSSGLVMPPPLASTSAFISTTYTLPVSPLMSDVALADFTFRATITLASELLASLININVVSTDIEPSGVTLGFSIDLSPNDGVQARLDNVKSNGFTGPLASQFATMYSSTSVGVKSVSAPPPPMPPSPSPPPPTPPPPSPHPSPPPPMPPSPSPPPPTPPPPSPHPSPPPVRSPPPPSPVSPLPSPSPPSQPPSPSRSSADTSPPPSSSSSPTSSPSVTGSPTFVPDTAFSTQPPPETVSTSGGSSIIAVAIAVPIAATALLVGAAIFTYQKRKASVPASPPSASRNTSVGGTFAVSIGSMGGIRPSIGGLSRRISIASGHPSGGGATEYVPSPVTRAARAALLTSGGGGGSIGGGRPASYLGSTLTEEADKEML